MRKWAVVFFCVASAVSAYAGDVANFVSLGFSPDGGRFAFAQYGVTDGAYSAYADIFCVDIAKNAFVADGVFALPASAATAGKDGAGAFSDVQGRAAPFLAKQAIDNAAQGRALYVFAEENDPQKEIAFRDFDTGASYRVTVSTLTVGSGATLKSSFYITLSKIGPDGKEIRKVVGSPAVKRAGVKGYLIRRIVVDQSGKSLVFVIEKTVAGDKGDSVRYMVETIRL